MKNLWKVTFDAKYTHCGDLMPETANVIANSDGLKAVSKAKREVIGRTFEDENGAVRRCVKVKLVGLELLHEIDA